MRRARGIEPRTVAGKTQPPDFQFCSGSVPVHIVRFQFRFWFRLHFGDSSSSSSPAPKRGSSSGSVLVPFHFPELERDLGGNTCTHIDEACTFAVIRCGFASRSAGPYTEIGPPRAAVELLTPQEPSIFRSSSEPFGAERKWMQQQYDSSNSPRQGCYLSRSFG